MNTDYTTFIPTTSTTLYTIKQHSLLLQECELQKETSSLISSMAFVILTCIAVLVLKLEKSNHSGIKDASKFLLLPERVLHSLLQQPF